MLVANAIKGPKWNRSELLAIDRWLLLMHDHIISNVGFVLVFTGLGFSLFTRWGFVRFYWVAWKWLLLIALFLWILLMGSPTIAGLAAAADLADNNAGSSPAYQELIANVNTYCLLQLVLLSAIVLLSVFKPWGPTHWALPFARAGGILLAVFLATGIGSQLYSTYVLLPSMRRVPLADVALEKIPSGIREGVYRNGYEFRVQLEVRKGGIKSARVLSRHDNTYARLAEGVLSRMIRHQSLQVDSITGATTTSRMLLKASERALLAPEEIRTAP